MATRSSGEIGTIGVNAAVATAAFDSPGVHVRDLPIGIEKLLTSSC